MDAVAVQMLAPMPMIVIKSIRGYTWFDKHNKNHFAFVPILKINLASSGKRKPFKPNTKTMAPTYLIQKACQKATIMLRGEFNFK
jgi:hypothetical protein